MKLSLDSLRTEREVDASHSKRRHCTTCLGLRQLVATCLSLAFLFAAGSTSAEASQFLVWGSGKIDDEEFPGIGVPNEVVTFSFMYDDADFDDGILLADGRRDYFANVSIPVTLVGSISGAFPAEDISRVRAGDFLGHTFDQWNYVSGTAGTVQANNAGGAAFASTPVAFSEINETFVNQLQSTTLWSFANPTFALNSSAGVPTLPLVNSTVMVAAVPEPSSLILAAIAVIGGLFGYRPQRCRQAL